MKLDEIIDLYDPQDSCRIFDNLEEEVFAGWIGDIPEGLRQKGIAWLSAYADAKNALGVMLIGVKEVAE